MNKLTSIRVLFRTRGLALLAPLLIACVACAPIPDIVFVDGVDGGETAATLDGGVLTTDGALVSPELDATGADHPDGATTSTGSSSSGGMGSSGGTSNGNSSSGGGSSGSSGGPGGSSGSSSGPGGGPGSSSGPGGSSGSSGGPGGSSGSSSGPGATGGCPMLIPVGADACCADVPCVGMKCSARCSECAACDGQYCCVPNGNGQAVTCAASSSACGD